MRDPGSRSGLMKLSLVALLALGLFAVAATGCRDDETPPEGTPAEPATTATFPT